jgi:hypothetical protein
MVYAAGAGWATIFGFSCQSGTHASQEMTKGLKGVDEKNMKRLIEHVDAVFGWDQETHMPLAGELGAVRIFSLPRIELKKAKQYHE